MNGFLLQDALLAFLIATIMSLLLLSMLEIYHHATFKVSKEITSQRVYVD